MLKRYTIGGWQVSMEAVESGTDKCLPTKPELVMINGIAMKGKQTIIFCLFQKQVLEHLHSNHMTLKKHDYS